MKYYEIDVMHEVAFVPGIFRLGCVYLTSNTINYSKFALVCSKSFILDLCLVSFNFG